MVDDAAASEGNVGPGNDRPTELGAFSIARLSGRFIWVSTECSDPQLVIAAVERDGWTVVRFDVADCLDSKAALERVYDALGGAVPFWGRTLNGYGEKTIDAFHELNRNELCFVFDRGENQRPLSDEYLFSATMSTLAHIEGNVGREFLDGTTGTNRFAALWLSLPGARPRLSPRELAVALHELRMPSEVQRPRPDEPKMNWTFEELQEFDRPKPRWLHRLWIALRAKRGRRPPASRSKDESE